MKIKIRTNLIGGIFFLLLSVIGWILIPSQIQVGKSSTTLIDAQFIPKLTMILICIFSIVLIVLSLINEKYEKYIELNISNELKVVVFYIMLIGYVLLIPIIGYEISSILFCGVMLLYFKAKKWTYYIVSFSVVLVLSFIFSKVLGVPLP
ncbi:MAG: tripartite tricarboxylate transporter TctB family protein [Vallitalea sp.]|jgi:preprotein translocase subunit SecG|nr:tripartite tricarboxylate transporter TctB family protein [Vallitalea sp.]